MKIKGYKRNFYDEVVLIDENRRIENPQVGYVVSAAYPVVGVSVLEEARKNGELHYYERVASPEAYPFGIEGEDGREYFEISSCCSLCEEKGEIQKGHFACHLEKIPEGFREETDSILTSSGWKKLISCRKR